MKESIIYIVPIIALGLLLIWVIYQHFFKITKGWMAKYQDKPIVTTYGLKVILPKWLQEKHQTVITNHISRICEQGWESLRRVYGKGKPWKNIAKEITIEVSAVLGSFPDPRYGAVAGLTITKKYSLIALRWEMHDGGYRIRYNKPYLAPLEWELKNLYDFRYDVLDKPDGKPKNLDELKKIRDKYFFPYDDAFEPEEVLNEALKHDGWRRI